jgi:hypothetical protein
VQNGDAMAVVSHSGGAGVDEVDGGDLEKGGVAEWRARGLPPAQSKDQRWGAPYHLQFRILFIRCALPAHRLLWLLSVPIFRGHP